MTFMKTPRLLLAALFCLSLSHAMADEKPAAAGCAPLFDGKTLDGWRNPCQRGKAEVVNGEKGATYKFRNLRIQELD
jgi:hypothetical protein